MGENISSEGKTQAWSDSPEKRKLPNKELELDKEILSLLWREQITLM